MAGNQCFIGNLRHPTDGKPAIPATEMFADKIKTENGYAQRFPNTANDVLFVIEKEVIL